ncbi:MAG TPA: aldehyde dehydrogenase family protein [Candidatus Sulfotelmatobacter sp.]|nr:aldehyde dehydrogenase family protein [Candidatus Sulfotelmatobacter sp.]
MLVRQPFDGAPIAEIPLDDANSLSQKLDRAIRCFADRAGWLPAHRRIEILRRLARLMQHEFDALAMTIAREGGKPLIDARIETTRAINGVDGAAGELEHLAGREIPMGLTPASQDRWAFTTKEPIGVVAAISAFNHPLNLIVHQVAPAIATGCPVIIKPANTTPLSCRRFVELVHEAGLPPEWCQLLVVEDNALAESLVTHPSVAFLSFIGSAKVGWYLRSKLAPGARCALEHGGAAPVIVDRSVDVDAVIEPLVKGGYYHAGQVCVSVQRIFAHADVMPRLVDRLTKRVRTLRVGDPTLPDTEMGPLILPKEVDRVAAWVAEARDTGGTLATGGEKISDRVYAPTVIVEPPAAARVSQEEVFGPVTCVYAYTDLDEAIGRANRLPFAFQSSVFARDIDVALKAARALDASTVLVNDHTAFRVDWMPFAGRHRSGYGVGGIPYTMHDMTQDKMIVLRW